MCLLKVWQLPADVKIDPNMYGLLYISHILDEKLCENPQLLQVIHQVINESFKLRNAKVLQDSDFNIEAISENIDPWKSRHANMKKKDSVLYRFNWDEMPEIPHLGNLISC